MVSEVRPTDDTGNCITPTKTSARYLGRGDDEVDAVDEELGDGEEEGDEDDPGLLDLERLELLVVHEAEDAPGLAEEEAEHEVERDDGDPGAEGAGELGGVGVRGDAGDGEHAGERHAHEDVHLREAHDLFVYVWDNGM